MVTFNKDDHTYKNPVTGEFYISVSRLLSLYKEPFDRDFLAEKTAKKEGVSKEEIIKKWAKINKDACDKGQNVHSIIESYLKEGEVLDEKIIDAFEHAFDRKQYKLVRSEMILDNDEYQIAGTSDMICDVDNDYFDVCDIKTNKKFTFENKFGKHLLHPLNNLQQCHFNDYSIQLSLYAYMYSAMANKKVRKIYIVYYDNKKFTVYHTPYLFWEVSALLKHYKNNHGKIAVNKSQNIIAKLQS